MHKFSHHKYLIEIEIQFILYEEFEDTKGIIRIRKSKKNRQHNGQKKKNRQHNGHKKKNRQHYDRKKKNKTTNNDLHNTTQKTKDRVTCNAWH